MGLAHEGLDHAHAGQAFLHHRVERVEPRLHLAEEREGASDNEDQADNDERDEHDEKPRQLRRGDDGHDQTAGHHHGRAHHDAQEHENDILHLGDVVGEARDQLAGLQFVDVGEGEHLHASIERAAQVCAETLGGEDGEEGAADAADDARKGRADHPEAGLKDDSQVRVGDAHVDDALEQARLHEVHRHFQHHEQGGEGRPYPVGLEE